MVIPVKPSSCMWRAVAIAVALSLLIVCVALFERHLWMRGYAGLLSGCVFAVMTIALTLTLTKRS